MSNFVAYIRVSTARQGRSGLGLSAQRARITEFVGSQGKIVEWYEEHESGAKSDRKELERALTTCELTGNTLVVATLSRLSRDVMFLETVKQRCESGGFRFVCVDMPEASAFVLGIMSQVAQYERELISQRTRAALQVARRRGTKLGNPMGVAAFQGRQKLGQKKGGEVSRAGANKWAEKRRGLISELVESGLNNRQIASALTARKIMTRRGGIWSQTSVKRLRDRLGRDNVPANCLAS